VRSVEASSTTITSSGCGSCSPIERRTEPSTRSALWAGMTTLKEGATLSF
jgi:hypothetical protein